MNSDPGTDSVTPAPDTSLPFAERRIEDVPGHWLLARMGKRVLRPGGAALTDELLRRARLGGADVVELAPGLGRTAGQILREAPRSYVGIDRDPDAVRIVSEVVGTRGTVRAGSADDTGLPTQSADVVVGEAMLTMQTDQAKRQIIAEAVRVLRPGGRYAIHELGLQPDDLDPAVSAEIRRELAQSIKVNARPLTCSEWRALLQDAGLRVEWAGTAPMALLQLRRNLADEGLRGTARIVRNVAREPVARRRLLAMRATFRRHRDALAGVALVATKPAGDDAP